VALDAFIAGQIGFLDMASLVGRRWNLDGCRRMIWTISLPRTRKQRVGEEELVKRLRPDSMRQRIGNGTHCLHRYHSSVG
jgi:hypothetical protein